MRAHGVIKFPARHRATPSVEFSEPAQGRSSLAETAPAWREHLRHSPSRASTKEKRIRGIDFVPSRILLETLRIKIKTARSRQLSIREGLHDS
jgi:hypothetical protein